MPSGTIASFLNVKRAVVSDESESLMIENQPSLHILPRLPDEILVAAAKKGEPSAIEELLSRYRSHVFGVVRCRAENTEEAEDIVQETMLRAFVNIERFRGDARFSSWLITIATNVSISMKRKLGRVQWIYLDDPNGPYHQDSSRILADHRPTPEQRFLQKEHRKLLQQKILKLSPKYRIILQTHTLHELSIEDTAQALGITCAAARSRLHRARRMLLNVPQVHSSPCRERKSGFVAIAPSQ
jgi:RNA polymerase sigma-70 factor (ECF subfamily)